jgi:DNA-binding NarL/FixJ family response regulator
VKRPSVLLADDHRILTDVLANLLRKDFELLGIAHDGQMMVELTRQHRPDVLIADISMPLLNGIDAARIIRKEVPSTRIVFLTMHSDAPIVEEAFNAGAAGFLVKLSNTEELLEAVHTVARGETYITPIVAGDVISKLITNGSHETVTETKLTSRQRQMLQLLAEGKTMKEAAAVMDISSRTAESHKYEIMRKLGVETTAALVRYAVQIKLV